MSHLRMEQLVLTTPRAVDTNGTYQKMMVQKELFYEKSKC